MRNESVWKNFPENLHGRVAPNIIVCDHSLYENAAQWARWFSSFKYCQVFLAHLIHLLAWCCSGRLLPLGLRQKEGIQNTSYPYWLLKTVNLRVYSRDIWRNAAVRDDTLSILTAGVCWMTWWSPAKCCIQTVINLKYHKHRMYVPVLIKIFCFPFRCYFI
jgi:hypothetical protein